MTSLVAPAPVRAALRRGLALLDAGHGGKGLRPATVQWARRLAAGEPITLDKAAKMRAWFARHTSRAEVAARRRDPTSPASVAYLLWGGSSAAAWASKIAPAPKRNPGPGDYEPAWASWENLFREAEPGERFVIPQSELERVAGKKAVALKISGEDDAPLIGAIERLTGRHPRFQSRASDSDGKHATWTILAGRPCTCSVPTPRARRARKNPGKGFWRSLTQPMQGDAPAKQYERLHWGIKPRRRVVGFEVPGMRVRQEVVQLGKLRALVLNSADSQLSVVVKPRAPYPRLVVGAKDNRLYIADHGGFALPPAYHGATILRVDYDATKGRESAYFYHDHEPDYPRLRLLAGGLPQYAGGSYVVAPEGITG